MTLIITAGLAVERRSTTVRVDINHIRPGVDMMTATDLRRQMCTMIGGLIVTGEARVLRRVVAGVRADPDRLTLTTTRCAPYFVHSWPHVLPSVI